MHLIRKSKQVASYSLLLTTALVLAACTQVQANHQADGGQSANTIANCPVVTPESWQFINAERGYCLLYPLEYKLERTSENSVDLVIDTIMNHIDPRVSITVEPANGRTAEAAAEAVLAGLPAGMADDLGTTQETITVGGESAEMLNILPGQDFNRRVFVVHEDRLYKLFFSPVLSEDAERDAQLEALYEQVIDSLTFFEPIDEAADACLAPKADMALLRQEEHGYCVLHPAHYQTERTTDSETVIFVDSIQNVEDPKLFIEVQEGAGQTAVAAADELIASLPDDFSIERTMGVLMGFEAAEQLDNVPGQDIGRVIFVAHNGRLYRLTFVPASPDAGEVYAEMETLYSLVRDSFRFLP